MTKSILSLSLCFALAACSSATVDSGKDGGASPSSNTSGGTASGGDSAMSGPSGSTGSTGSTGSSGSTAPVTTLVCPQGSCVQTCAAGEKLRRVMLGRPLHADVRARRDLLVHMLGRWLHAGVRRDHELHHHVLGRRVRAVLRGRVLADVLGQRLQLT